MPPAQNYRLLQLEIHLLPIHYVLIRSLTVKYAEPSIKSAVPAASGSRTQHSVQNVPFAAGRESILVQEAGRLQQNPAGFR